MKVRYTTADSRMTIELEGRDTKELFTQLSVCQEIFEHRLCGACGSANVRFVVREVQGNTFYEIRCADCGATLAFGQKRSDGSLFPKRRDKDGNWLPNNGWVKWSANKEDAPF